MPLHDFRCSKCAGISERVVPAGTNSFVLLASPCCGQEAEHFKVFLRAPVGFVRQDVHYTSPVDGRPITNHQQHLEELARTDTVVYEPGIKQDQERNQRKREEGLERSMDETVEREIETMPVRNRERLAAELEGGITAEPVRVTPPQVSYRDA